MLQHGLCHGGRRESPRACHFPWLPSRGIRLCVLWWLPASAARVVGRTAVTMLVTGKVIGADQLVGHVRSLASPRRPHVDTYATVSKGVFGSSY